MGVLDRLRLLFLVSLAPEMRRHMLVCSSRPGQPVLFNWRRKSINLSALPQKLTS